MSWTPNDGDNQSPWGAGKGSKNGSGGGNKSFNSGDYDQFVKDFQKKLKQHNNKAYMKQKTINKSIKFVKMGKTKEAEKALKPAVKYLLKINCKKIILGCTELPIAIFAYKSFKKAKLSKTFLDPNLILAEASMKYYKK